MWIGEDLDSVAVFTNYHMAGVRLKTQACWLIEIAELFLAKLAKGVEVGQGGSMEPLETMVAEIRDNHLFMLWIIDDGVRTFEFTSRTPFLTSGAQERLLIHLTILG